MRPVSMSFPSQRPRARLPLRLADKATAAPRIMQRKSKGRRIRQGASKYSGHHVTPRRMLCLGPSDSSGSWRMTYPIRASFTTLCLVLMPTVSACSITDIAGEVDAGSVGGQTGSGPENTAVSICGSNPTADLTMGQACTDSDMCDPGGCFRDGAGGTQASFATCRNHQVQIIMMTLLDVPADGSGSPPNDGVSWTDCNSALASGLTGEACTWPSTSCVQTTTDSCCLEGAECVAGNSTAQNGLLRRVRICAPGCTNLKPDTTTPVVTDCASAASVDTCHTTAACQGDFICYGLLNTQVTAFIDTNNPNGAMWCAGGSLVGGYGFNWGV